MPLFTQYLTVQPWQRALERLDGARTVVLEPGRHPQRTRAAYQVLDLREQLFTLAPQELLTADGVTVKVSAALRWRIGDPVAYTETVADPLAGVYLAVQIALREGLAPLETDAVIRTGRQAVAQSVTTAALEVGRAVGIEVLDVVVKDVILPADLRAAYGAVVAARQRALAQLEAARAETAALRSLANGAKLLDDHPALAQLRIVQSLPPGSTIELSLPAAD
jgi:regulator of protease activity HflC (stomatin/prohibitin superfamily)